MNTSKCCDAQIKVNTADEGTSCYVCSACGEACDIKGCDHIFETSHRCSVNDIERIGKTKDCEFCNGRGRDSKTEECKFCHLTKCHAGKNPCGCDNNQLECTREEAYKTVIADMKGDYEKCKSYVFGCSNCAIGRLLEDLEDFYDEYIKL